MNQKALLCLSLVGVAVVATVLSAQAVPAEPAAVQIPETPEAPLAPDQTPPEVQAALGALQRGDLAGAIQQIEEAVKKHPEFPPAKVVMAELLFKANQPGAARNFLEQAALDSPPASEAYSYLGDLARREQQWAEAELLYQQALKLAEGIKENPQRRSTAEQRARKGLAAIAEPRKDWPGMQKHAEAALQLKGDDSIALQLLGEALFQQGKADEALAKFREAAKADPKIRTPEVTMAVLYEEAGDRQKAMASMISALKANERDLKLRLEAAQWALDAGLLDQAKDQASSALVIDPSSLQAKVLRGLVALLMKDYPVAEEWLQKALLQDPDNFAVSNNLALCLIEQDDEAKKARALKYAQINTRLHPQSPDALATYGWVAYKRGSLNEAEAALNQAMQAGAINPDTLYYRARIAVDRKNTGMAKQLLDAALKANAPFMKRQEAEQLVKQLNP
jgi:Tfp pilus assembly protein PilF